MLEIYKECPVYQNMLLAFRKTSMKDAEELLKCYSDEKAVPFFNSDNCNGDDFHYTTLERMEKAISFWDFSYENGYFVRWTVIHKATNEKIGTIEMFHRLAEDEFNHYGLLRIDLRSDYERQEIIEGILEIAREHFFKAFEVENILTKAVPQAADRIEALLECSFEPLGRKLAIYDDYYICSIKEDEYGK